MNNTTKQAFKALYTELKKRLNDAEAFPICDLKTDAGTYLTDEWNCDDKGNWGLSYSSMKITEEDALKDAQYDLLNGCGRVYLDDTFFEGELRNKIFDFMTALSKEVCKC